MECEYRVVKVKDRYYLEYRIKPVGIPLLSLFFDDGNLWLPYLIFDRPFGFKSYAEAKEYIPRVVTE